MDAGKNIAITQSANKISIATKDDVSFTKTTVGKVVTNGATNTITGLAAPTGGSDATNKTYVDNQVTGAVGNV
ncbi:hypothetical protein ACFQ3H_02840, partial [Paralysiella testudinis]|uniref:hypothetical protein n=1 Tax=Paralysiella testudinis TaxID=2809020 RepID=UPI00363B9992